MRSQIIILILFAATLFAQDKYYVFFTDKGFIKGSNSESEIVAYKLAKSLLSKRALERRARSAGESFVDYDDIPVSKTYVQKLKNRGVKIVHQLKWFNAVSAFIPADKVEEIKSLPFVSDVKPVPSVKISHPEIATPIEKTILNKNAVTHTYDYGPSLTQVELSDIPILHDMLITGKNVRIGLMDSGFDWKNQESTKNLKVIAEHDFVFGDTITANEPEDNPSQHNHGTLVLSTIGGFAEGKLIGPAFDAEYVLAKTENISSETHAEEDNYAKALEWFEALGVDIASSSLGYSEFDNTTYSYKYSDMNGETTIVTRAAEKAFRKGMITVTSAGNEGNSDWFYITAPGDGFNTITVGAVTSGNVIASFSSRGPTYDGRIKPDVCAMGVSVIAADARFNDYAYYSGTSLSAPIVAGICAQVLSKFPYLTNEQMRQIIIESGDNTKNPDNERGYGLLSALRAITYPHVKNENGREFIVKKFFNQAGVDKSDVKITIESNNSDSTFSSVLNDDYILEFELPQDYVDENITFSFSYKDNNGNWYRDPAGASYSRTQGSMLISHYASSVIHEYIPKKYFISNVYPNPFNGSAKYEIELPDKAHVNVTLYDVLGREVKTLINSELSRGYYTKTIEMNNYASGVYLLHIRANEYNETKKIINIK